MRPLVVELCGLPGAGKTTLARSVVEALGAEGVEAAVLDASISAASGRPLRIVRRLGLASAAAVQWPSRGVRSALWFASGRQRPVDAAAAYVQWLAVQSIVHRAGRDTSVHLLEEGALQTLWTALLRSDRPLASGPAWAMLPPCVRSDVVLLVDVPVEIASARLARRGSRHSRTQLLDPGARSAELRHGRDLLEHLVDRCPVPVIRVDGDADADGTQEQTASHVAGHLLELVADRDPGPR